MSIIVKGMKMPEDCMDCKIKQYVDYENDYCVCPFSEVMCLSIGRQDACPLVALPDKHGRLIDADAIVNAMNDTNVGGELFVTAVEYVKLIMNDADAIVEAEGES